MKAVIDYEYFSRMFVMMWLPCGYSYEPLFSYHIKSIKYPKNITEKANEVIPNK